MYNVGRILYYLFDCATLWPARSKAGQRTEKMNRSENRNTPDKAAVLNLVRVTITESAQAAKKAMDQAQESANSESKSSMGDKYETGRAMAQLDRDLYARRYDQIIRELEVLERIGDSAVASPVAKLGSLVKTTVGWVLLAVSLGVLEVEGQKVLVVSGQSPLGKLVVGKRVGDRFVFQGKEQRVESIN